MNMPLPSKRTLASIAVSPGQPSAKSSTAPEARATTRKVPPLPSANGNSARLPVSRSVASDARPARSPRRNHSRVSALIQRGT